MSVKDVLGDYLKVSYRLFALIEEEVSDVCLKIKQ